MPPAEAGAGARWALGALVRFFRNPMQQLAFRLRGAAPLAPLPAVQLLCRGEPQALVPLFQCGGVEKKAQKGNKHPAAPRYDGGKQGLAAGNRGGGNGGLGTGCHLV